MGYDYDRMDGNNNGQSNFKETGTISLKSKEKNVEIWPLIVLLFLRISVWYQIWSAEKSNGFFAMRVYCDSFDICNSLKSSYFGKKILLHTVHHENDSFSISNYDYD